MNCNVYSYMIITFPSHSLLSFVSFYSPPSGVTAAGALHSLPHNYYYFFFAFSFAGICMHHFYWLVIAEYYILAVLWLYYGCAIIGWGHAVPWLICIGFLLCWYMCIWGMSLTYTPSASQAQLYL